MHSPERGVSIERLFARQRLNVVGRALEHLDQDLQAALPVTPEAPMSIADKLQKMPYDTRNVVSIEDHRREKAGRLVTSAEDKELRLDAAQHTIDDAYLNALAQDANHGSEQLDAA